MESDGTHRRGGGQSRQAAGRWPPAFGAADALFARAEDQIALLRRCRPSDGRAATNAWLRAHRRGERCALDFRYAPAPDLGRLRHLLDLAVQRLAQEGAVGALYAARGLELSLEARLAERVGCADFASLARQRHAEGPGADWQEARRLAQAWAALPRLEPSAPRIASDDARSPDSLWSVLARALGQRRLPLRLVIVPDLASRAACGDGVIFVAAAQQLMPGEARRIAAHELEGHALPRLAARVQELGLWRIGSARSTDDEEGRALHIEAARGLLDDGRRRELGLRHAVAVAVASGADAHECLARLGQFGCDAEEAVAIYARVARGGGLCRELEYLPAWLRFAAALRSEPELASWLACGRLSLDAARVLHAHGVRPHRGLEEFSTCQWQAPELPRCLE